MDDDDERSAFSSLSKRYKKNPTIENYVSLRREYPDEIIEIAISSAPDWLFANQDLLRSFKIPPELVAKVLDADFKSISELSLILLERIIERKKTENSGQTHAISRGLVISDSLINFQINVILDSMDWNDDLQISRDLIILLRERIGGEISEWDTKQRIKDHQVKAIFAAIRIGAAGEKPSYRKIGEALGVNATTVMRWFPEKKYFEEIMNVAAELKKTSKP